MASSRATMPRPRENSRFSQVPADQPLAIDPQLRRRTRHRPAPHRTSDPRTGISWLEASSSARQLTRAARRRHDEGRITRPRSAQAARCAAAAVNSRRRRCLGDDRSRGPTPARHRHTVDREATFGPAEGVPVAPHLGKAAPTAARHARTASLAEARRTRPWHRSTPDGRWARRVVASGRQLGLPAAGWRRSIGSGHREPRWQPTPARRCTVTAAHRPTGQQGQAHGRADERRRETAHATALRVPGTKVTAGL